MIARVCAAEVARQIVRALHLPSADVKPVVAEQAVVSKPKASAKRKKKKAA